MEGPPRHEETLVIDLCIEVSQDKALPSIELILVCECEAWTLTKAMTKSLDWCYTRMLRVVQNVSWKQHMTCEKLYGPKLKLTEKVKERRLRICGQTR